VIALPTSPQARTIVPRLVDFGIVQRPATGGALTYIDRPGMRMAVQFEYPPMRTETARPFISRLLRAKSEGLRIPLPLAGVLQGSPGTPLVNGGTSAGTSLLVKGLTPGYQFLEGYWLNVVDAGGIYYLHNVAADVAANGSGLATVSVWPPLRADLVDGNTVVIGAPSIEGLVPDPPSWPVPHDLIVQLSFTVEEAA
jgi:hypothetical protein